MNRSHSWALGLCVLLAGSAAAHADDQAGLLEQLRQRDQQIQILQEKIRRLERDQRPPAVSQQPAAATATNASSMFAVDALSAERALERTLTQSGALLLPVGQAELQFGASYAYSQQQAPTLIAQDNRFVAGTTALRRQDVGATVTARFGLPSDAQLDVTLPYRVIRQSLIEPVDAGSDRETRRASTSVGDLSLGLAKTLMREQGWRPDLIGRIGWTAGNGKETSNDIHIGDGFRKIRGELTMLKRQDPIVWTTNLAYESTFKKGAFQPGAQVGLSLAALLAASPESSLSVGVDQTFSRASRINGVSVAGSDQRAAVLTLGASSLIGKNTLLSVSAGIGLTRNTPDYVINVALPIRFDLFN
ncbi:transporter [Actimicrobium sp. CCI2.3]|uniref:transporter n=1 Tax=Actimicrobium sp. CCI2.3 TaxID=3048616 RepID=UPI002AB56D66|nr:transporter [Actimicrobium sp. CCI2.3]MDY7573532.1 transporter [Actimicrobium sp. CCI2.3]MEB0022045.1 transporter [Actimicrobium sp. CCI2.3]